MLELAIKNAAEELPSSVLNEYIGDQARADGTFAISNYSARVTAITNMFGKGFTPEQVCQVCFFMTHVFCMNTFVLGVSLMFVPTAPLPHLSCVLPTSSSPHLSPQFVDSTGSLARPAPVEYDRMAYAASASASTPTNKTPYDVYCEAVKASEAEHMGRMLAAYTEQRSRSSFQQWADWRAGVSDDESDSKGKRKSTL